MSDDSPKHPGRILFDQVMTPLGVSRNKLARDIDVPVGRISDIVAGKRGVTPDTALRLAKYFGTTPELWLRLQADYDLNVARTTTWRKVEAKVAVLEPSPDAAPVPAAPAIAPAPVVPAAPAAAPTAPAPITPIKSDAGAAYTGNGGDTRRSEIAADEADDDYDQDEDIDIPEPLPGGDRP